MSINTIYKFLVRLIISSNTTTSFSYIATISATIISESFPTLETMFVPLIASFS